MTASAHNLASRRQKVILNLSDETCLRITLSKDNTDTKCLGGYNNCNSLTFHSNEKSQFHLNCPS